MALQGAFYAVGRIAGAFARPADLFIAYQVNPGPLVYTARLLGVACDLATLVGVAVIGERLRRGVGLAAAVLIAVSPVLIFGTRKIDVDAPMMAFAVWALERLLAWQADGTRRAWIGAIVLIGLAAGTKYPGGLVWIPLAWAAVQRDGPAGIRRALVAALASGAVLLATSPFLLVEFARVRADARVIGYLLSAGQLGNFSGGGTDSVLTALLGSLGRPAIALCVIAVPLAFGGSRIARAWALIWIFVLAFAIPTALTRVGFSRYLLPAVPGLALIASGAVFAIVDRVPVWRSAALAALLATLVFEPAMAGLRTSATGAGNTQTLARQWMEANVPESALIVEEPYAALLRSCPDEARILSSPAYANASERWKARFRAGHRAHVVTLPFLTTGRAAVGFARPGGGVQYVDLWPNSSDLNQVFYEPALYRHVDLVVTSAAIRGRYETDAARYPRQMAFYAMLDRNAREVARFRSTATVSGPEIRVFWLDDRWRSTLKKDSDGLDPLWWADEVPEASRQNLAAMTTPGEPTSTSVRAPDGSPARWVLGLGGLFDEQIAPFCYFMAAHLVELERFDAAREFAGAIRLSGSPDAAVTRAAGRLLANVPAAPKDGPRP
jgi:hypothetical protein